MGLFLLVWGVGSSKGKGHTFESCRARQYYHAEGVPDEIATKPTQSHGSKEGEAIPYVQSVDENASLEDVVKLMKPPCIGRVPVMCGPIVVTGLLAPWRQAGRCPAGCTKRQLAIEADGHYLAAIAGISRRITK